MKTNEIHWNNPLLSINISCTQAGTVNITGIITKLTGNLTTKKYR